MSGNIIGFDGEIKKLAFWFPTSIFFSHLAHGATVSQLDGALSVVSRRPSRVVYRRQKNLYQSFEA